MNLAQAEQIARAVLYEGYMLYPYRPSAVKNQQRFNFGVLYPQHYTETQAAEDPFQMQTECIFRGNGDTSLQVKVRFLHLRARFNRPQGDDQSVPEAWQESIERDVSLPACTVALLSGQTLTYPFSFLGDIQAAFDKEAQMNVMRRQEEVTGIVDVRVANVQDNFFKVGVSVRNVTAIGVRVSSRNAALMQSLVSTHTILGVAGGEFVSLLDPPAGLKDVISGCKNLGGWPVLIGEPGQCDTMLASPIILYDHPQIAPESPGDLFDGTEIDEILSLRIMTLTDEEKDEIRRSDERAREILERTEAMPAEQFMKLHGAVRGMRPIRETAQ